MDDVNRRMRSFGCELSTPQTAYALATALQAKVDPRKFRKPAKNITQFKNLLLAAGPAAGKTRILLGAILTLALLHSKAVQLDVAVVYTNEALMNQDAGQYEVVKALHETLPCPLTVHRFASYREAAVSEAWRKVTIVFFDEVDHKAVEQVQDDPVDFLNMPQAVVGLTATPPEQCSDSVLADVFKDFEFHSVVP